MTMLDDGSARSPTRARWRSSTAECPPEAAAAAVRRHHPQPSRDVGQPPANVAWRERPPPTLVLHEGQRRCTSRPSSASPAERCTDTVVWETDHSPSSAALSLVVATPRRPGLRSRSGWTPRPLPAALEPPAPSLLGEWVGEGRGRVTRPSRGLGALRARSASGHVGKALRSHTQPHPPRRGTAGRCTEIDLRRSPSIPLSIPFGRFISIQGP